MEQQSSEQSIWVAPGLIGNEFNVGYDVLRGMEMAKVMSESQRLFNRRGDRVLERQYGKRAISLLSGEHATKGYVLRDNESGLYLKSYSDERDAEIQFAAMNMLHAGLADQDVGVSAVRHFALISRKGDMPVAVIEPATGQRIGASTIPKSEQRVMMRDVRARLTKALGKKVSRTLVNDLSQLNNLAANVFLQPDGAYQIIDQPALFPGTAKRVYKMIDALGWELPLRYAGVVEFASFDPFDVMRAQ